MHYLLSRIKKDVLDAGCCHNIAVQNTNTHSSHKQRNRAFSLHTSLSLFSSITISLTFFSHDLISINSSFFSFSLYSVFISNPFLLSMFSLSSFHSVQGKHKYESLIIMQSWQITQITCIITETRKFQTTGNIVVLLKIISTVLGSALQKREVIYTGVSDLHLCVFHFLLLFFSMASLLLFTR